MIQVALRTKNCFRLSLKATERQNTLRAHEENVKMFPQGIPVTMHVNDVSLCPLGTAAVCTALRAGLRPAPCQAGSKGTTGNKHRSWSRSGAASAAISAVLLPDTALTPAPRPRGRSHLAANTFYNFILEQRLL